MAGLLRRLRRRADESEAGAAEPKPEVESATPPEAPGTPGPKAPSTERPGETKGPAAVKPAGPTLAPEQGPKPAAAASAPPPVVESGPPPPLPPADLESVRAANPPRAGSDRCFLCNTELLGSYCPTCRMTWNE